MSVAICGVCGGAGFRAVLDARLEKKRPGDILRTHRAEKTLFVDIDNP
jgi:hypothetical protein